MTDNAESATDLLTIEEVGAILRVPPATVRYCRQLGIGPNGFRVGRHVRYRRSDVIAWLDALAIGECRDLWTTSGA